MISVCMGVKNGASFITDQIKSILPQIGVSDEIIISDDRSSDNTVQLIEAFNDPRIKVITNPGEGITSNFENCLHVSRGEIIFLSDQDDVWAPNKVAVMLQSLRSADLVVSDCVVVNHKLEVVKESFFKVNQSGKGIVKNLIHNSYIGCCMAFHRRVLTRALPFPKAIPVHDLWIGLIAERYFSVAFIPMALVYHRRHFNNASSTSEKSSFSSIDKLSYRFQIIRKLIQAEP